MAVFPTMLFLSEVDDDDDCYLFVRSSFFLPRIFFSSSSFFRGDIREEKNSSAHAHEREVKACYLCVCVCCLAKQIYVRRKKNNRCIKFSKREQREREKRREKRKKEERIGFAYAERNILFILTIALERCHEADVVSLIGRRRERERE